MFFGKAVAAEQLHGIGANLHGLLGAQQAGQIGFAVEGLAGLGQSGASGLGSLGQGMAGMGQNQTAKPARGRKKAVTMKAVRYRLAKWLAMSAPSRWAAQNRAMAASIHVNTATWIRLKTEKAMA